MGEKTEGWALPGTASRMHYMRDGMALCRKWGFYRGGLLSDEEICNAARCSQCRRLHERDTESSPSRHPTPKER